MIAGHDPLTGLPDRDALLELLAGRMADPSTAVILMDLDGFEAVNDQHGRVVGDRVLRDLAERLRDSVRRGDVVARYGGDEFAVVAEVDEPAAVTYLTTRLVGGIERPFAVDGGTVRLSASVGLAHPQPGDDAASLLARADAAAHLAKQSGHRSHVTVP